MWFTNYSFVRSMIVPSSSIPLTFILWYGETGTSSSLCSNNGPCEVGEYAGEVGEYGGEVGEYGGELGEYGGELGSQPGVVGLYGGELGS
jgi:hypothetical protein